MNPTQTTMRLMQERNIYTCQVAGCNNPAEEAHHVLYSKRKGVKERVMNNDIPERDPNPPEYHPLICPDCGGENIANCMDNREDFVCLECEYRFYAPEVGSGFDTLEEREE